MAGNSRYAGSLISWKSLIVAYVFEMQNRNKVVTIVRSRIDRELSVDNLQLAVMHHALGRLDAKVLQASKILIALKLNVISKNCVLGNCEVACTSACAGTPLCCTHTR